MRARKLPFSYLQIASHTISPSQIYKFFVLLPMELQPTEEVGVIPHMKKMLIDKSYFSKFDSGRLCVELHAS